MKLKVIDGHCDVLYKMYEHPAIDFYDPKTTELDVNFANMIKSGVKIQCFAVYLAERITQPQFDHYLEYINIFYQKVIRDRKLNVIKTKHDLERVWQEDGMGGILTLEGADAIQNNPLYTKILFYLGVRMIGMTWNYANWAADGVLEPRKGGLTRKGKGFVKDCNDLGILLDASHLSTASFWDLAAASSKPFVATHSNVKALCDHPRNLDDHQIRELIQRDGRIGVTFVPWFVKRDGKATVEDVVKHIEYLCEMGGEKQIVLGSDFDGIDQWIPGLENAGQYGHLADLLYKRYSDAQVNSFLHGNWYTFLHQHLPVY